MSGGALCVATDFSVLDASDAADADKFVPRVHTAADSRLLEIESLNALPNGGEGCTVLGGYSLDEAAQKMPSPSTASRRKTYTLYPAVFS